MSRQCARPGCGDLAVARLTADFRRCEGWLRDLSGPVQAHEYPFCLQHADRLTLPRGWSLYDERSTRLQAVAAPAPEPPTTSPPPPPPPPAPVAAEPPPAGEGRQPRFTFEHGSDFEASAPLLARAFRALPPDPAVEPGP